MLLDCSYKRCVFFFFFSIDRFFFAGFFIFRFNRCWFLFEILQWSIVHKLYDLFIHKHYRYHCCILVLNRRCFRDWKKRSNNKHTCSHSIIIRNQYKLITSLRCFESLTYRSGNTKTKILKKRSLKKRKGTFEHIWKLAHIHVPTQGARVIVSVSIDIYFFKRDTSDHTEFSGVMEYESRINCTAAKKIIISL